MYWLSWCYSLADDFYLSIVITFFDKFVIESENDVLVLPFEDGFGSFVLL